MSHQDRLLSHVQPRDWPIPTPAERYDLVVLGGGTAGLVAAMGSAGLGATVALVEKHMLGGDCLNFGCIPSKGVLAAAHAVHALQHGGVMGVSVDGVEVDFGTAMERMRRIRADIAHHDSAARLRDAGVDVFQGEARFTGSDTVRVGETTLRFKRSLIATGARARVFPIPGMDDIDWVDNVGIFGLVSPRHTDWTDPNSRLRSRAARPPGPATRRERSSPRDHHKPRPAAARPSTLVFHESSIRHAASSRAFVL